MESVKARTIRDLTALWACRTVLVDLHTDKARGKFLIETFTKNPKLVGYFRWCYDDGIEMEFHSKEVNHMAFIATAKELKKIKPIKQILKHASDGLSDKHQAMKDWWMLLGSIPIEQADVANMILDGDLKCGVTAKLLNKVFKRMELPLITVDSELAADRLTIEITSDFIGDAATATMLLGDKMVMDMSLRKGKPLFKAIRLLREAGIEFKSHSGIGKTWLKEKQDG